MKIVIFGLAITSSWGNGHASTFRALCSALHARGHRIVFFEHDAEWYASNRDMPHPPFCDVRVFEDWDAIRATADAELRDADVAMLGSYFPDSAAAADVILNSRVPRKTFYDIDTPITVGRLRRSETNAKDCVRASQLPGFDLYFSFTGGPILRELEEDFGVRQAVPLYCSFNPERYLRTAINPAFRCDLSYMGTYAPDRQPKIDALLTATAAAESERRFIVAGPQYPADLQWPRNVRRIMHLEPKYHPEFYSSSRFTLNVTRRDMVMAGYSPSVRLFEAAATATAIISDNWPGLESFFAQGKEILLPTASEDVGFYLEHLSDQQIKTIGEAAQARVLDGHTSQKRAEQFENYVSDSGKALPASRHATPKPAAGV